MPKRLRLEEHLSSEELEDRYRKARDPVLRSHYQIVWLLSLGKLTREVREVTGYSPEWIREISLRYNELGAEGLGDHRHQNPGASPLLSPSEQHELSVALQSPPRSLSCGPPEKLSVCIVRNEGVAALGLAPNRLKARREAISKVYE
jgi:hypothetical protein